MASLNPTVFSVSAFDNLEPQVRPADVDSMWISGQFSLDGPGQFGRP
jgi:hypothetical protein